MNTNFDCVSGELIPNGAHIPKQKTTGEKLNIIFTGSAYLPNVYAAQRLADLAHQLPAYTIHLIGPCSEGVETTAPNVIRHGYVNTDRLNELLLEGHVFVNLITNGSGTHLKIAEALAYGIPVITSRVGARGYDGDVTIVEATNKVVPAIHDITTNWVTEHKRAVKAAKKYDWSNIRKRFAGTINAFQ